MLDIMYDIPSEENITEVVVNEEVIRSGEQPIVVYRKDASAKEASLGQCPSDGARSSKLVQHRPLSH